MFGFVCHVVSLQLLKPAVCSISQGQHIKESVAVFQRKFIYEH